MIHHHTPTPLTLTPEEIESIRRKQRAGESPMQPAEQQPKPSLLTKAKHVAQAGGRIAKAAGQGERIRVSDEERDRRLAICRECDLWNEGGNVGLGECKHPGCGCTRFKHGLATETCPAGKWPAAESNP